MLDQQGQNSAEQIALFVFVPFCKIKCTYCDFNAYANLARLMEPYSKALVREIENAPSRIRRPSIAKTLYIGGGTPSLVPATHIQDVVAACRNAFNFTENAEITLEVNPGTVNEGKLSLYQELGINRLSIGIQSFDEATVRRLNRGHTVRDAVDTYCMAREAGFGNVNLDLIYGLPLQRKVDWEATLARALELRPEHLSLYALKVEQGTGLEKQIERGVYLFPDDDIAADMYLFAEETLKAAGYEHYEISNWARIEQGQGGHPAPASPWRSKHNLTYWEYEPYIGFGVGAHSFYEGMRYWNLEPPAKYIEALARGDKPVEGSEEISRELQMAESAILALRLNHGLSFTWFRGRFGEEATERFANQLAQIRQMGLGEITGEGVRLNSRGRLVSNEVFWRFLP